MVVGHNLPAALPDLGRQCVKRSRVVCMDSEGQVAVALWQQHLVAENESEENEFACCQDFFLPLQ